MRIGRRQLGLWRLGGARMEIEIESIWARRALACTPLAVGSYAGMPPSHSVPLDLHRQVALAARAVGS